MLRHRRTTSAALLLAVTATLAGCSSSTQALDPEVRNLQPGAPGEPNEVLTEVPAAVELGSPFSEADAAFMRDMQVHHQQALTMTALVPDRTERADLPLFTRRMDISQEAELEQLERLLVEHQAAVERSGAEHSGEHDGGHATGHADMPGMLSDAELAALEAAEGEQFDRLFLAAMTRHHNGALQMVADLLAQEGTAADPRLFEFVGEVDSDQRIELDRMQRIAATMPPT